MGSQAADSLSPRGTQGKRRSAVADFLVRLVKEKPLGAAGGMITVLLLLTGIFADLAWLGLPDVGLAPYGMNETHMEDALRPPSARHVLGTDNVGRDILSRVIYGARVSVIVGLSASVLATFINLVIGIACGYIGGKLDLIVQRLIDSVMCIPSLVLLMVTITITKPGMLSLIIVLGLMWGIVGSRVIRGAVIGIKGNVYVAAAKAIGCSTRRILVRHILPNIMAPTIVVFTVRVPAVILTEAALSFLCFGIPPPFPSWGGMLSGSGRDYMFRAPWMAFWPGLALAAVVYGVNMFGDAVRDLLDPRLRGGVGRYGAKGRKRIVGGEPGQTQLTKHTKGQ